MIEIVYHNGSALPYVSEQCFGFENAEGNGSIHCYRLLDGVSVMLMRLELESYTEVRTQTGRLEINFCAGGRFETHFSLRDHVLLKPGDMAISCYDSLCGARSESHFPLGYYEGVCLLQLKVLELMMLLGRIPREAAGMPTARQSRWSLCAISVTICSRTGTAMSRLPSLRRSMRYPCRTCKSSLSRSTTLPCTAT